MIRTAYKSQLFQKILLPNTFWLYLLLILASILLPLLLWQLHLPLIQTTHMEIDRRENYLPFELFGACTSISLVLIASIELSKAEGKSLGRVIPILVPLLICFYMLSLITEYSDKSTDYIAYEGAAKAIVRGTNPYILTPRYLYPPFLAQVMVLAYRLIEQVMHLPPDQTWNAVFYLYQSFQFLAIILAYFLSYFFARNLGVERATASFLVAPLFLFNNPLIRTLSYNQINLWVLDSFLLAVVLIQSFPLLAGFAISIGVHIKLYPLMLLPAWVLTNRRMAIAGGIVGFFAVLFIETNGGYNWELWQQFFDYFTHGVEKPLQFRNNSLTSVIYNFFVFSSEMTGLPLNPLRKIVVLLLTLAILIWLGLRFIRRERFYTLLVKSAASRTSTRWADTFRYSGHSMDAITLSLLISPSAWEHHYVLAMPVVLWAIITRWTDRLWLVGCAAFLVLCIPTFDIYLLSYHRLVGLLILIALTSPEMTYNYFFKRPFDLNKALVS